MPAEELQRNGEAEATIPDQPLPEEAARPPPWAKFNCSAQPGGMAPALKESVPFPQCPAGLPVFLPALLLSYERPTGQWLHYFAD